MAIGTLLLREPASSPLTSLVQQALTKKPPFLFYDLRCQTDQFQLHLLSKETQEEQPALNLPEKTASSKKSQLSGAFNATKNPSLNVDEGFESDIDSVSLLSSEDGNPSGNPAVRSHETDSANGSVGSDSDDTDLVSSEKSNQSTQESAKLIEIFNLVDCMCYSDSTVTDLLIFVIKEEVLVFKFENNKCLQEFYKNFSTLKAICNQKAYGKSLAGATKFNLLQRTDENGVTHIQVTRQVNVAQNDKKEQQLATSESVSASKESSLVLNIPKKNSNVLSKRSVSIENILERNFIQPEMRNVPDKFFNAKTILRKVWNSAEDLLDSPQRPERRKKSKSKSPDISSLPVKDDLYKGQYVKVGFSQSNPNLLKNPMVLARTKIDSPKSTKSMALHKEKHPSAYFSKSSTLNSKPYQQFKYSNFLINPDVQNKSNWTNSVPRFFKKARSRSETRIMTPMAYRYVDTTTQNSTDKEYENQADFSKSVANRLFGMSSKLRDFSSVPYSMNTLCSKEHRNFLCRSTPDFCSQYSEEVEKSNRSSLADLTMRLGQGAGSLKSVIKKNDKKKKPSDKKVTFSAYTTVQVV